MNENITWGLLLRWGIDSGYSQTTVYISQDGTKYHVYENMAFTFDSRNRSPLDIYLYDSAINNSEDLEGERVLAFTKNRFIERSAIWEKKIAGYFESLLKIKNKIDLENAEKAEEQREEEARLKAELIKEIERYMSQAIKPTIILLGDNPQHSPIGTKYREAGYTALDIYNNDITDDVIVDTSEFDALVFNNMIMNSNFTKRLTNWSAQNVNTHLALETDKKRLRVFSLANNEFGVYTPSFYVRKGQEYTFAISMARGKNMSHKIGINNTHLVDKTTGKMQHIEFSDDLHPDSGKMKTIHVTFIAEFDSVNASVLISRTENTNIAPDLGVEFYVENVKFNPDGFSIWTPAPEELESYQVNVKYSVKDRDGDIGRATRKIIID